MTGKVPNLDLPLGRTTRNQTLTIRTELNALNNYGVPTKSDRADSGFHVPDAHRLIRAAVSEGTAIGTEGQTQNGTGPPRQVLHAYGSMRKFIRRSLSGPWIGIFGLLQGPDFEIA